MRLIDADALIEKCGDWYVEEGTESGFIGTLKNLLATQPTIQPEPHWIPVTERLPKESGEYLVTVKWVTGDNDVDVYEYDARHKTWNDGESAGGERAIAWMPLPEPYKEVTE